MEDNDRFGSALTALPTAGADDLVIGVPNEDLGLVDKLDAGVIHFVPGFPTIGLDAGNAIVISQDTSGIGGGAESNDQFGRALAAGDFNGNGQPDLAVGVPFEDLTNNTEADAGAVNVLFDFNGSGFDASESQFVSQANLPNVAVEAGNRFGWALAAGDFDGDGRDDLAIGVPTEDIGSLENAGTRPRPLRHIDWRVVHARTELVAGWHRHRGCRRARRSVWLRVVVLEFREQRPARPRHRCALRRSDVDGHEYLDGGRRRGPRVIRGHYYGSLGDEQPVLDAGQCWHPRFVAAGRSFRKLVVLRWSGWSGGSGRSG